MLEMTCSASQTHRPGWRGGTPRYEETRTRRDVAAFLASRVGRHGEDDGVRSSFQPELFAFLEDLKANNDREWFAANSDRYEEHLLEPAIDFIEAFGPRLEKISPNFRADARPSGGSLFRIYRDTRFSKDKTPYKTNLGIHFRHELAKDTHAPGYYLHIGPGEVFAWRRDVASRHGWGDANPRGDRRRPGALAARDPRRCLRAEHLELGGDSLKRVP